MPTAKKAPRKPTPNINKSLERIREEIAEVKSIVNGLAEDAVCAYDGNVDTGEVMKRFDRAENIIRAIAASGKQLDDGGSWFVAKMAVEACREYLRENADGGN